MATNVVLKKDGRMNSVAKHMTLGVHGDSTSNISAAARDKEQCESL